MQRLRLLALTAKRAGSCGVPVAKRCGGAPAAAATAE